MDGSPDRAGVVLGSSEASLPLHCPQDAIRDVHVKGLMYQWIARDMEKYILRGDETFTVLSRLVAHGKQLFLITNSPFSFVDKGMSFPFLCLPFSLLPHSRELNLSPRRPGVFCYRLEVAL